MKLIDLLVKELPRLGGWPTCDNYSVHNSILSGIFQPQWYPNTPTPYAFRALKGDEVVYESQYEAALAKAQQQAWSGDGLPPVGCECEVKSGKESWTLCKVVHSSSAGVAFIYLEEPSPELSSKYMGVIDSVPHRHAGDYFRPIRTEADRKREIAVDDIASLIGRGTFSQDAESIYDAIAAGKIPGVKLE